MLSENAAKILIALINNDDLPMTAKKLSTHLKISERSVNSYLGEVEGFCKKEQLEISIKPRTGVRINVGDKQDELLSKIMEFSSVSRVDYIADVLLNNWTTYTTALFADDLMVSKSTVTKELKEVEALFSELGLKIYKQSGKGIAVEGSEAYIRNAIIAINRRSWKKIPIEDSIETGDYRLTPETYVRLSQSYREEFISNAIKLGKLIDIMAGIEITDLCFEMLVEYLVVVQKRISIGKLIPDDFNFTSQCGFAFLNKLSDKFSQVLGLKLTLGEEKYICMLIECCDFQYKGESREAALASCSVQAITIGNRVIEYVSDALKLDFECDLMLKSCIYLFLNASIVRVHNRIEFQNTFLNSIKQIYPAIFNICYALVNEYKLATQSPVGENEIASLSLIIGGAVVRAEKDVRAVIVYASDVGMAQIAARKIEQAISRIMIEKTFSFSELSQINNINPHIIISTIPNLEIKGRVVHVTPVINNVDIIKIKRAASEAYTKINIVNEAVCLSQLLREDLIFLNMDFSNKERVIEFAANALTEKQYTTPKYLESVLHREGMSSTAIGRGVAMPHSVVNTIINPAICLMQLSNPIDWSGDQVDVVFVLALNFNDISSVKAFYKGFYEITSDSIAIDCIRKAKMPCDILKIIKERGE